MRTAGYVCACSQTAEGQDDSNMLKTNQTLKEYNGLILLGTGSL